MTSNALSVVCLLLISSQVITVTAKLIDPPTCLPFGSWQAERKCRHARAEMRFVNVGDCYFGSEVNDCVGICGGAEQWETAVDGECLADPGGNKECRYPDGIATVEIQKFIVSCDVIPQTQDCHCTTTPFEPEQVDLKQVCDCNQREHS